MALTSHDPMVPYTASKKFAELALWEWADKHPHVDVTTLNPTFFYGPFTPHYTLSSSPDLSTLSTNKILYRLLFPPPFGSWPRQTMYIDVRDVAAAHVRALSSPLSGEPGIGRKRIILSSPTGWNAQTTRDFIAEKRPSLQGRLIKGTPPAQPVLTPDVIPFDLERVEVVLGLKKEDFKPTEETILDSIDALLAVEDEWRGAGHEIKFEVKL